MTMLLPMLVLAAQPAAQSAAIEGRWKSPGGNSIIAIAPCGDAMCGTVAWASAQAKQDSIKSTPQLVGTAVLTGLHQKDASHWQGRLFIPDQNMRVTAKIQALSAQQLKVSGCLAGKALCKSQLWNRFDGPLPATQ